jgi:AAA domain
VGFNLSSSRMRTDLAKTLKTCSRGHQPDFDTAVEDACNGALRAYRAGTPSLRLREAVRPEGAGLILPPIALGTMPTILYGDGGNAKSLIALAIAETIETGRPILGLAPTATGHVGFLDWEMDAWTHRERALALTGQESDVRYIACARPLADDVDRIRSEVRRHQLTYLIVDSIALACDGPPEAAEVANRFFGALRSIGLGSLLIAHTTKGENSDAKPFGSAFWHNGARLTWLVKRQAEIGGTLRLGLFNKKANTGPIAPPMGFDVVWGDQITLSRTDVQDIPDLADHVPLKYRMTAQLRAGALTIAALAGALDVPTSSVAKALDRGKKGGEFVQVAGPDGVYRWGLRV